MFIDLMVRTHLVQNDISIHNRCSIPQKIGNDDNQWRHLVEEDSGRVRGNWFGNPTVPEIWYERRDWHLHGSILPLNLHEEIRLMFIETPLGHTVNRKMIEKSPRDYQFVKQTSKSGECQ